MLWLYSKKGKVTLSWDSFDCVFCRDHLSLRVASMISCNHALFLFTIEVGWFYVLGGIMLIMSRLWLLYLLVVVLGSFHHVVSLLCIYWRMIIIFLFINFHFHQWNSLQTLFGIVWQLCYGMPIQTSFYFLTNLTYRVRFTDVSLHVCISLSVSVELGLRFQQSFHTIHLLRSSETHLISSHISIAAGAIYPIAEMVLCLLISMDRNCSTICLHLCYF